MVTWEWWRKGRLLAFLQSMAPGPQGAFTVLCPPQHPLGSICPQVAEALAAMGEDKDPLLAWPMGVVCFWAPVRQVWVLPPFRVDREAVEATWDSPLFNALYERPARFGLLLVRRGGYALGIAEGESLRQHKVGSRYVQGRNKAGGSSAPRFERRRREQVHHLLRQVCDLVQERWEPYKTSLEALFLGGDRLLLNALLKECPFLRAFTPIVHPHWLPVGEPGLEALGRAVALAWQSQVALTGLWEREC
ncbi:MAG: Vms1/Ankzf1 family peptidyl-tRNA hydrolase [Dehalococcoidia bacterium]